MCLEEWLLLFYKFKMSVLILCNQVHVTVNEVVNLEVNLEVNIWENSWMEYIEMDAGCHIVYREKWWLDTCSLYVVYHFFHCFFFKCKVYRGLKYMYIVSKIENSINCYIYIIYI